MTLLKPLRLSGVALLSVSALFAAKSVLAIEKASYTVLEKEDEFEIRRYDPQILAETFVDRDLEEAGNEGFRRLFAYISGDNQTKQSIAMTAPVSQESRSEKIAMTAPVGQEKKGNQWRITFLMPARYTLDTLPEPNDSRINIVSEPVRHMAAIRYSGTWSKERYLNKKAALEDFIRRRSLTPTGSSVWARYDPPFMPWFLRRNEVLIPVEDVSP